MKDTIDIEIFYLVREQNLIKCKISNFLKNYVIFKDDHSRIKLKEISETDYINANLIENTLIDRKYILTQVAI